MDKGKKMSSANRGIKRLDKDKYDTPSWLVEAILPYIMPVSSIFSDFKILEPACGSGNIVNVLKEYKTNYPLSISAYDIEPRGCGEIQDFLTGEFDKFDLVLMNPPYSLAMEFVQKALTLRRSTSSLVVALLRLNWLGSKKRAEWLRENTPSIYVSPKRPSFSLNKDGKRGTDSTEYCWMIWGEPVPRVHILNTDKIITKLITNTSFNAHVDQSVVSPEFAEEYEEIEKELNINEKVKRVFLPIYKG